VRRTVPILLLALTLSGVARGQKPDFHVVMGAGWLRFDFETFGVPGAPEVSGDRWGPYFGVGWTWAEKLRLGVEIGGWPLTPGASCGHATAIAEVPVVAGFSLLGSLGGVGLTLSDDSQLDGFEVGAGATYTVHLAGRVAIEGRYSYLRQRYFEEDVAGVTIHPDATGHTLGVNLIFDL
jgi:hypothetical protein